jgi:excisionase family DNA binding protein
MNLLTLEQVQERVPLSMTVLYRAAKDGELRATKLRGRWMVDEPDLDAWVDAGRPAPPVKRARHRRAMPFVAPARRGTLVGIDGGK